MYAKPENHKALIFYQYRGLNNERQSFFISPGDLLSPIGKLNVAVKFQFLVKAAFTDGNDSEREQSLEKLRELIFSVGEIYNRRNPKDPIHSLEILECSIDLTDRGRSQVKRKSLWQVELKDGSLK